MKGNSAAPAHTRLLHLEFEVKDCRANIRPFKKRHNANKLLHKQRIPSEFQTEF